MSLERCPYGRTRYEHYEHIPWDFPCSGIHPGSEHVVDTVDWLRWLTDELLKLRKEQQ